MTQPAPKVLTLLAPADVFARDGEIVNRVVTKHPFDGTSTLWVVDEAHPLVPKTKIVRMFVIPGECVEVYGVKDDMKMGVRNLLPWHTVLLTEDTMIPAAFTSALEEADKDEDPDPEPKPLSLPAVNGGPAVPSA